MTAVVKSADNPTEIVANLTDIVKRLNILEQMGADMKKRAEAAEIPIGKGDMAAVFVLLTYVLIFMLVFILIRCAKIERLSVLVTAITSQVIAAAVAYGFAKLVSGCSSDAMGEFSRCS